MENLTEALNLDVEEQNELLFKVVVEGAEQAPASIRLICENTDGMSYMFKGTPINGEGVISFNLPPMVGKLKEGTYDGKVEVLIENKCFTPVQFKMNFKKTVKVVAEAVVPVQNRKQELKISAQPIVKVVDRQHKPDVRIATKNDVVDITKKILGKK